MTTLSKTEHLMYRLLLLDPPAPERESTLDNASRAERAFGFSLMFSAVRCILQYVILPFVLPVIGITLEAAIPVVLAINVVALVSIVYSVRRFWQVNYKYKWQYLPVAGAAFVVLSAFIVLDVVTLLG